MLGALGAGAAGLIAGSESRADDKTQTDKNDPQAFPRFHPGVGGPIGSPSDRGKLTRGFREQGLAPVPVEMPDLPKLPWKMVNGVKEYHLVCEVVRREFLPGQFFYVWGFNGTMPGPLIEAVQGDRVRFVVHNNLPEPTVVHWHGLEMPVRYDGVEGLTQDPIKPGESFSYEFDLHQDGSFFYHSHGAMQEIMGMSGMLVIHPKTAYEPAVDHDFALIFQEFAILPQAYVPNSVSMEFNWFTINGRSGPFTTPLVVRHGSRVRVRLMNMSAMDHHPVHLHGHTYWLTGSEGGRIPESAWIPRNTVLVGVAQVHDFEFIANNVGDWPLHCHIPHHMMNHMTSMTGPDRMLMGSSLSTGTVGLGPAAVPGASGIGMGMMGQGMSAGSGGMASRTGGAHAAGGAQAGGLSVGGALRPMDIPAGLNQGPGQGQINRGPALSMENGPSFGRGLGGGTNPDHPTRTGPAIGGAMGDSMKEGMGNRYDDPKWNVPGWPLDMMDMKEKEWNREELAKIKGRDAVHGMRHNWFIGVSAMMTSLRVLPDELYKKVISGADIPDGANIPGSGKDEGDPKDKNRKS